MSDPSRSVTGEESLGLEICMLWGNTSVNSVVFAAVVPSAVTPLILSAMLLSYWGVRPSSVPKVSCLASRFHLAKKRAKSERLSHNLAHFLPTFLHMQKHSWGITHLYTIPRTAWGGVDGLDIWSWLTRRENEEKPHSEEKRQNVEWGSVQEGSGRKSPSTKKERRSKNQHMS